MLSLCSAESSSGWFCHLLPEGSFDDFNRQQLTSSWMSKGLPLWGWVVETTIGRKTVRDQGKGLYQPGGKSMIFAKNHTLRAKTSKGAKRDQKGAKGISEILSLPPPSRTMNSKERKKRRQNGERGGEKGYVKRAQLGVGRWVSNSPRLRRHQHRP